MGMPSAVVIVGIYRPDGAGDSSGTADEYVVLVNMGDEAADLRGWSLTNRKADQQDHYRYLFPRFMSNGDPWELEPGGLVFIFTGRGTNGCTATVGEAHQFHLYQHRQEAIWQEPGDIACLYDRKAQLQSWWELPGVRRMA